VGAAQAVVIALMSDVVDLEQSNTSGLFDTEENFPLPEWYYQFNRLFL
jgi:hypothetical protein